MHICEGVFFSVFSEVVCVIGANVFVRRSSSCIVIDLPQSQYKMKISPSITAFRRMKLRTLCVRTP